MSLETDTFRMEWKLVNSNGSSIIIKFNVRTGDYLLKMTNEKGGMHLMFIKDVEEEVEMLKGEGYLEVK